MTSGKLDGRPGAKFTAIAVPSILAGGYWLLMSPWSQLLGRFPYRASATRKVVALTFDDGPNEPYTSQIADYLHSEGIKATFFQVGENVRRHPDLPRRLAAQGHVIANHSMSHKFRHYLSQPRYRRQLEQSQRVLETHLGQRPALFRPPWLWRGPVVFGGLRGQHLVPVSGEFCHSLEVFRAPAARIAKAAVAKAKPGKILIFHDGFNASTADRSRTVEAVRLVVGELRLRGFQFATVDELLGVEPYASSA
jgi:peptidoglycan/xylan/chitin deacetylase (PgdA/CDA1 family)